MPGSIGMIIFLILFLDNPFKYVIFIGDGFFLSINGIIIIIFPILLCFLYCFILIIPFGY